MGVADLELSDFPFPSLTRLAIALICAGVVPQQPPMILTIPFSIKGLILEAIVSGVSSYSPISLGSPALACMLTA